MAECDSNTYGVIYCVTNTVTGKKYVGQTTTLVQKRWKEHCRSDSGCAALRRAINKYGRDAFEISTLASASSASELNFLEVTKIAEFDTIAPRGYNLREGGGAKGKWPELMLRVLREKAASPESRAMMSASSTKMWKDPAIRARISDSIRLGLSNPLVKKKRSEKAKAACNTDAVKARMSASQKLRFEDKAQCDAISVRQKLLRKDPIYRERLKVAIAEAQSKPEYRENISEKMKALWQTEEYRSRMLAAQKERRRIEKIKSTSG